MADSHLISRAAQLIKESRNILVLTGAGISVSAGIPDFRSSQGLYAQLRREAEELQGQHAPEFKADEEERPSKRPRRSAAIQGLQKRRNEESVYGWIYDLHDPQEIMDIKVFRERPEIFYSFADRLYPKDHLPTSSHRWIRLLEEKGKLLRNYTQNIDGLEARAGVTQVIHCHGSFATASCIRCGLQVPGEHIAGHISRHEVPKCNSCRPRKGAEPVMPVLKPDITFFHEAMKQDFADALRADLEKVDLLLVMGTSLSVDPVKSIPARLPPGVPVVLLNMEQPKKLDPDVWVEGDCDASVTALCEALGWQLSPP